MKEDRLKKFIDEHKEQFEFEFKVGSMWDNIEANLDQNETRVFRLQRFLPYAAAGVILLLSLVFIFQDDTKIVEEELNEIQEDLQTDFGEVEAYYVSQVNDKLRDLEKYNVDDELLEEIHLLKKEFDALKIEMGYGADPAIILEAMIENYRLRIEILEDLLGAFDKTKKKENEILQ